MKDAIQMGVLCTDHVADEARARHGDYPYRFALLFATTKVPVNLQCYEVQNNHYPQSVRDNDVYLITGSKASVYEDLPWIQQLQHYVRELADQSIPLIGICFGHQIVAQSLGGLVRKSEKGWGVGVRQVPVLKKYDWMRPEIPGYRLLYSHQDQVIELPQDAASFAGDEFCPHAGMQINNHVVTLQGHPEFSFDYMQYLIDQRRKLIGEERYQQARASLSQPTDQQAIARWLLQACDFWDNSFR